MSKRHKRRTTYRWVEDDDWGYQLVASEDYDDTPRTPPCDNPWEGWADHHPSPLGPDPGAENHHVEWAEWDKPHTPIYVLSDGRWVDTGERVPETIELATLADINADLYDREDEDYGYAD